MPRVPPRPAALCAALLLALPLLTTGSGCGSGPAAPRNYWPDGNPPALTPEAQATVDQLELIARGQPGDLDGDGFPEYRRIVGADGVTRVEIGKQGATNPLLVSTVDDAGNMTVREDATASGRIDKVVEVKLGPPQQRVVMSDTNGNGVLDKRVTETYDFVARTTHVVVEIDASERGAFAQVAEGTLPIGRRAGGGECTDNGLGSADWPVGERVCLLTRANGFISRPNNLCVRMAQDAQDTRGCTPEMLLALQGAFDCMMGKAAKCLEGANPAQALALTHALNDQRVEISCGNRCPAEGAIATRGEDPHDRYISVNPDNYLRYGQANQCQLFLHEVLHTGDAPDGGPLGHDDGNDELYSCGRYCAGFVSAAFSKASDCIGCASSSGARNRLCYVLRE
jgi:hypothetical protein